MSCRLEDVAVRRFLELRDAGANAEQIAAELGISDEAAGVLVHADEAQALAHRIAIGEEPSTRRPSRTSRWSTAARLRRRCR